MQSYIVGKIYQLITQHAKQIILYDLEIKTTNWRFITNEILNMNYLTDSVRCFNLDLCKVMQLAESIS